MKCIIQNGKERIVKSLALTGDSFKALEDQKREYEDQVLAVFPSAKITWQE